MLHISELLGLLGLEILGQCCGQLAEHGRTWRGQRGRQHGDQGLPAGARHNR